LGFFKTVYPRMRGGTFVKLRLKLKTQGLSPHERGNLKGCQALNVLRGSIPACAGEPGLGLREIRDARVYPRMRGGTEPEAPKIMPFQGLSPHARGNLARNHFFQRLLRSIPACAGEPTCHF